MYMKNKITQTIKRFRDFLTYLEIWGLWDEFKIIKDNVDGENERKQLFVYTI